MGKHFAFEIIAIGLLSFKTHDPVPTFFVQLGVLSSVSPTLSLSLLSHNEEIAVSQHTHGRINRKKKKEKKEKSRRTIDNMNLKRYHVLFVNTFAVINTHLFDSL